MKTAPDPHSQSFLITGCVRNASKTIGQDIAKLLDVFKHFPNKQFLLIESDSDDNTLEVLDQLSQKINDFRFISAGVLADQIPSRVPRLAHCRNIYVHELLSNPLYANMDYLLPIDLDGMCDLLTEEGVLSCWERDDWGAVFANQAGPYYDLSALRHPEWQANNCWDEFAFLTKVLGSEELAMERAIYNKMITIPKDFSWIKVESAFGGLGIYKKAALSGAQYVAFDQTGKEQLEHIHFNSMVRKNGYSIFINPRMINTGTSTHAEGISKKKRIKRLFKRLIQTIFE